MAMINNSVGLDKLGTIEDTTHQSNSETVFDAFVSINPDLKNDFGHYLNYEKRLQEMCQIHSLDYWVLAHKSASKDLIGNLIPAFENDSGYFSLIRADSKGRELTIVKEFSDTISNFIRLNNLESKRVLFFVYCGSSKFCIHFQKIHHGFRKYFTINAFWDFYLKDYNEYNNLGPIQLSSDINLLAMSEKHQNIIENVSGFEFDWIPNPPPLMEDKESVSLIRQGTVNKDSLKCYLPSLMSVGKGEEVTKTLIQLAGNLDGEIDFLLRDKKSIFDKLPDNFTRILGNLTDTEIFQLYQESSIVFLPYEKDTFAFRTSGAIVDCLVFGCVPIVFSDTWLSHICDKYNFGIVLHEPLAEEFVSVLQDPSICLLYTSPSPRDRQKSRMPSSA